jgi:hypothetical protein
MSIVIGVTHVELLVVRAVGIGDAQLLDEARRRAVTGRDRRLVVLAERLLAGDHEQFDALVRDHLVEHPDHVLAAWLAQEHAQHHRQTNGRNPC